MVAHAWLHSRSTVVHIFDGVVLSVIIMPENSVITIYRPLILLNAYTYLITAIMELCEPNDTAKSYVQFY